jgi:hypothetical protein
MQQIAYWLKKLGMSEYAPRFMKGFGRCRGTRSPASPAAAHHPRATGQDHRCLYLADAILHVFGSRGFKIPLGTVRECMIVATAVRWCPAGLAGILVS